MDPAVSLRACRRQARPKMTTRERLFLPAWEKWTKYGRVPWKIVYNLLLVLCVTTKVWSGVARLICFGGEGLLCGGGGH